MSYLTRVTRVPWRTVTLLHMRRRLSVSILEHIQLHHAQAEPLCLREVEGPDAQLPQLRQQDHHVLLDHWSTGLSVSEVSLCGQAESQGVLP